MLDKSAVVQQLHDFFAILFLSAAAFLLFRYAFPKLLSKAKMEISPQNFNLV